MPELPEVETVKATLENLIKGEKIQDIDILYAPIIKGDPEVFKKRLIGQTFRKFKRRGKYLIFELDDVALISHLRMEGKYFVQKRSEPIFKHTHVIFHFESLMDLRYDDTRKFGRMELRELSDEEIKGLGQEPLSDDFNEEYALKYLKNNHKQIKALLLDQSFVAGIGNIYADEILFSAKIHPEERTLKLNPKDIKKLVFFTKEILSKAIEAGGTTIRSYTSSLGVSGRFQMNLRVHTKEGQMCPVCGSKIIKKRVASRGTYLCPKCQRLKK